MKHRKKQFLSLLASAALAVCTVPQNAPLNLLCPAMTASAEDLTEGDFAYSVSEDQGSVTVTQYNGEGGAVVIPDTLGGLPVTGIAGWTFFNCADMTSVEIPDTVTAIGNNAFNNCSGLTAVTLPKALKTLDSGAFGGCSGLTEVTIPEGTESIASQTFASCTSLERVGIPESVTTIGASVFRGTPWLSAKQEENPFVTVNHILIDASAVSGDAVIPEDVTVIGDMAFSGCRELTGVTIPESVVSIGESAFYNCSALTGIVIPDGVESVGYQAFGSCTALKEAVFADSVTSLGGSLFFSCSALTSVKLPAGLNTITNSMFMMCSNLSSVVFPESLKSIELRAFAACSSLTELEFPEGTEHIGFMAFAMCSSLSKITLPDSVTEIESAAFSGCSGLTVCGSAGSYAQTYAEANGYPFEAAAPDVQTYFCTTAVENEQDSVLTDADGQEWFKVTEFTAGQDYIITVRNSSGEQGMLTVCGGEQSSYVWNCFSTKDEGTNLPYTGLSSGGYELISAEGKLVTDESLKVHGSVTWSCRNANLIKSENGKTYYLTYDESSDTPFAMTDQAKDAAVIEIYTNGEKLNKCIQTPPCASHYVLENSGYAAPEFRVELAEGVILDSITWYAEGEEQPGSGSVFTADTLKGRTAGVYRVSCLVEGHDADGLRYREESVPASFVVAKGVLADSVLTFSDIHEEYALIGDAIADVIRMKDGMIPALVVCSGDFCNGSQAKYDSMLSKNYPQMRAALGGLDAVYVAGNHDSAAAASYLSASAGLGAAENLSGNGGVIFRGGSEAAAANGTNSVSAENILVYGINFDAVKTAGEEGTVYSYENVIPELEQFLKETAADYHGELIIISAHTGMHVLGKQPGSVNPDQEPIPEWIGENMYNVDRSGDLAALINRYAEDFGMDIMYLFGHDHSRKEAEMLLKKGDTLLSTQSYADQSTVSQTLHFTYAHSGYLSSQIGSADSRFSLISADGDDYVFELIRSDDLSETCTAIPSVYRPDYADEEQFAKMSEKDYKQKTGIAAEAEAVRNTDGTVTVKLNDKNGKTLDTYTLDAKTGIGTDAEGEEVNLPQTGITDPSARIAVSGAALLIMLGAYLLFCSRRKKEHS